jgi:hypothetical protein
LTRTLDTRQSEPDVGLIPLLAVEVLDANTNKNALGRPDLARRMEWYAQFRPQLTRLVSRRLREDADRPAFQGLCLVLRIFRRRQWRGAGASHPTGWTGLIANLIDELHPPEQ